MARPKKIRLGDLLVSHGLLTDEQLKTVLEEQQRTGRKLWRVITEAGFATEESIARTLAEQLHATFVDLRTFTPKPELINLLPEATARRYRAIALDIKDGQLMVGFADPTDLDAFDEISRILQREMLLAVVKESELMLLMNRAYPHTVGTDSSETGTSEEEIAAEEKFDVYVSLPTQVEKEILAKRLADNIGIEADKLEELANHLTNGRIAKIRSEVPRKLADIVGDGCRRAGLEVEIRESLRLAELVEKAAKEETIQCPNCGFAIAAADNLKCPNCHLLIIKGEDDSEYHLKKKYEEEERTRIELLNEQNKKSNEQLLKDEQERKLREEVRAQLEIKKVNDLRIKKENELKKRKKINRAIQISTAMVIVLALTFAAGRWFAPKSVPPPVAGLSANASGGPANANPPAATPPLFEVKHINQAGKVELVEGDVHLIDIDKKQRTVKTGDALNEGDTIVTGKNGELHVKMRDDGFIAVRPNTDMQIVAYRAQGDDQDKGVFSLAKGSFRSVTGWIGKFSSYAYQVKTPTATIGVRGTDHEPLVIPPDSTEGEPGTYDKVNIGTSYIETPQGRVDVPAGKAAFSPSQVTAEKMVPRLLPQVPSVFKPTPNEKLIEPRHDEIQKTVEKQRDERHNQVEQVCRKE